jgi:hypothetical protein
VTAAGFPSGCYLGPAPTVEDMKRRPRPQHEAGGSSVVVDKFHLYVLPLDRLRLPRSVLGASPRYSQAVLDDWLQQRMIEPEQKRGGPKPPLVFRRHRPPTDVKAELRKLRRRLGY